MRVAIQGTHGVLQRGRRPPPVAGPRDAALPRGEGCRRRSARGPGGGRVPADRELPDRLGHHDVRPAHEAFGDGTLRLTHETSPGAPHHHGGTGRRARGHQAGLSHPVALGQCRHWLSKHLPDAELVSAWDTAGSAEIVAQEGNPTQAAIAARHAARCPRPGAAGRADRGRSHQPDPVPDLHPRGRRISPSAAAGSRATRPRSSCSIDHKPGMLALTLQAFGVARREPHGPAVAAGALGAVDLPVLRGHGRRATDPRVAEALEEVEALAARLVVLGSYEAWVEGSRLSGAPARRPPITQEARHPAGRPPACARGSAGTGAAAASSAGASRCSSPDPARSRARR